jgi:hypothetical protein
MVLVAQTQVLLMSSLGSQPPIMIFQIQSNVLKIKLGLFKFLTLSIFLFAHANLVRAKVVVVGVEPQK